MQIYLMVAEQKGNTKVWPVGDHWYAPIKEYQGDLGDLDLRTVVSDHVKQEVHIDAWERRAK